MRLFVLLQLAHRVSQACGAELPQLGLDCIYRGRKFSEPWRELGAKRVVRGTILGRDKLAECSVEFAECECTLTLVREQGTQRCASGHRYLL